MSDTINVNKIKPVGNYMLVRKCQRPDQGIIILPDQVKEDTNFVEVIAVGNKCKHFLQEHVGATVQCPDFADGMHCIGGEFWMVREPIIHPVVFE